MKVTVHMRKGGSNRAFLRVVDKVKVAMEQLPYEGRIKERLHSILKNDKASLSAAWQDGDELTNILGKNSEHRFDIYNWDSKTAVEIEESEVKYVWKDFVKLAIGARRKRVQNAILIVPIKYGGKTMKKPVMIYATAIKISQFMSDFLWMKNLAIIGYEK